MTTYKTVRIYADCKEPRVVIERGLTLAKAQEHCTNKETSSTTAKDPAAKEHTKIHGPWFDAYYEEN